MAIQTNRKPRPNTKTRQMVQTTIYTTRINRQKENKKVGKEKISCANKKKICAHTLSVQHGTRGKERKIPLMMPIVREDDKAGRMVTQYFSPCSLHSSTRCPRRRILCRSVPLINTQFNSDEESPGGNPVNPVKTGQTNEQGKKKRKKKKRGVGDQNF